MKERNKQCRLRERGRERDDDGDDGDDDGREEEGEKFQDNHLFLGFVGKVKTFLWLILCIFSLAALVMHLTFLSLDYLSMETTTAVSHKSFPNLTFPGTNSLHFYIILYVQPAVTECFGFHLKTFHQPLI